MTLILKLGLFFATFLYSSTIQDGETGEELNLLYLLNNMFLQQDLYNSLSFSHPILQNFVASEIKW